MDKLEYIPGDLAFHYIPKTIIKKYVKVYVCSTQNALSLEDMDGNLYDYIGELYPIPLTPEILEKNVWKKPDDFDSYWLNNIGLLQDGDTWHSALGSTKIAITLGNIMYVHQLQHLLFGLGLNSEMEV